MLTVDLMLEQLQRQRNMANARARLELEKKRTIELKLPPTQKRAEAGKAKVGKVGGQLAPTEPEMPYMKPVVDKHGKTIDRPPRPL